jgi:hypothetical protein
MLKSLRAIDAQLDQLTNQPVPVVFPQFSNGATNSGGFDAKAALASLEKRSF